MADQKELSKVEKLKAESRQLRGEIARELSSDCDHFGSDTIQLLKHHGAYQQDDRDVRAARAAGNSGQAKSGQAKSGKKYGLLIRTRVPGGRLTSEQMLTELDVSDELADQTLRITSRQGLQLHGVPKSSLKEVIQRINRIQLTTLGACGDVNRNVMCCPASFARPQYAEIQDLSQQITARFAPRTQAYHEIWLRDLETGDKHRVAEADEPESVEPLYGRTYLPRKFKIGIALPNDNCIDVYTHDLGLLGIVRDDHIIGYNVLVGGGMGVTPSNKKTFAALGQRLAFVEADQAIDVAEAIIKVFRDCGNRSDRKTARLKYLLHDIGLDTFRGKVEESLGTELRPPHQDDVHAVDDHIGWADQGDGRWCYGLNIENGRIADTSFCQLKSALRQVCRQLAPDIRLTAHQGLVFVNLAEQERGKLEPILRDHGVPLSAQISTVRRWSMACVSLPTCGLAITESERALPAIIDEMEVALAKLGLSNEAFTVRMTGCPNGCARPYNADIGLVGKAKDRYTILVGGSRLGGRLNFIFKNMVPRSELVATLNPLFSFFKSDRAASESFGDFCHRQGVEELLAWSGKLA